MTAMLLVPMGWVGVPIVGFMGIALWIVLIGLVVLVVRGGVRTTARDTAGPAVRLLEERYARGEITREEFLERRAVIDRTWPGAGPDAPRLGSQAGHTLFSELVRGGSGDEPAGGR
jgi:hypothetical protein